MKVEDWKTAGEVRAGKLHLVVRIQDRLASPSGLVRARTECGRLVWLKLVPWQDGWWEGEAACLACRPHVRKRAAAERRKAALAAAAERAGSRTPLTPEQRAARVERVRDMRLLETMWVIAQEAARDDGVRLTPWREERRVLLRKVAGLTVDLGRARRAVRAYGARLDAQDTKLTELRAELARTAETNAELARQAAKAELLREFIATLYRG